MNSVPDLRTERLRLRALTAGDEDAVVRIFAAPETSRYFQTDFSDADTVRAELKSRAEQLNPEGMGHWVFEFDGTVVGVVHLRPSAELPGAVAEIGWYLDPAYGGRGLATEAARRVLAHGLDMLGLPAVFALVHESNVASLNLAGRLGFLDVGSGEHYGARHRVQVALPATAGRTHHIELWVRDLARARHTFGWLLGELGWQEYQRWSAGISWRLGHTYLVVEQSPALLEGPYERNRAGLNHLALHGGTRERIDQLVDAAGGHGWRLMFGDRHPYAGGPEHYAAYLENEDGFEMEIVAANPSTG